MKNIIIKSNLHEDGWMDGWMDGWTYQGLGIICSM